MWLFCVGLYLCVFGLVLAFFSNSSLIDVVFNNHIDPVFWGSDTVPENALHFRGWIYGVLGSTIAGWGVFIAFLAGNAFKRKEKWARNCIFWGILIWFVPDTILSAYHGIGFNVGFNIVLLLLFMFPLICTRKHFNLPE